MTLTLHKKLWNTDETATVINLTRRALEAWRLRGGGPPYIKCGRAVRYAPDDVLAWLEAHRRSHTSDPGPADATA